MPVLAYSGIRVVLWVKTLFFGGGDDSLAYISYN